MQKFTIGYFCLRAGFIRFALASLFMFHFSLASASVMEEGEFYKEKQELIVLKQDLNEFYNKKETKYFEHKKELENILAKIELTKKDIEDIKKENQKIKDEITRVVVDRTITMYDKMKVKVVLDIFNTMVTNGRINEVFDIIVRLKQKRVLELLKKFDVPTKTLIMTKMKDYKFKQETSEGKK
ncbi:MAG: hypothetical protein KAQ94_05105 [Arcobacteraceae bacterium]|nr:hypothetical protein [Arcobacteraceae bacterium]